MNILLANWTWYPSGGDWTYVSAVKTVYESNAHTVIPFSMVDDRNIPSSSSKYYVSHIDYKELNRKKTLGNALKVFSRTIYSNEARRQLQLLLRDLRIDVAHLQNIHHYLTPSILPVLKDHGIRIIWTLHDYTLLCPENSFVSNGEVCEECKGGRFYRCAVKRCKKESFLASTAAALENYVHRALGILENVDYFICPSKFMSEKFIEFGFPPEKVKQIYNCLPFNAPQASLESTGATDRYILYVGRMEYIKGVKTLLQSVKGQSQLRLKLVGTGTALEEFTRFSAVEGMSNVEFLGFQSGLELRKLIAGAEYTVCPSEWYENLPYAVAEAMLEGKPVVGARIGGIPELVVDGVTGRLFSPGNVGELKNILSGLWNDPKEVMRLGVNAATHINAVMSPDNHYRRLSELFAMDVKSAVK